MTETAETEDALRQLERWLDGDYRGLDEESIRRAVVALRAAVELEECGDINENLRAWVDLKRWIGSRSIVSTAVRALLILRGEEP